MSALNTLHCYLQPLRRLLRYWQSHAQVARANPGCHLGFPIQWQFDDLSAIRLAPGVSIGAFSEVAVIRRSSNTPVEGGFEMGSRSVLGVHGNIRGEGGKVIVGRDCLLAQNVSLIAANHKVGTDMPYMDLPVDSQVTGVTIEDNVWIGTGVTILPGCVVGRNSIVSAGSVVARNIPPNEIWAGVPARRIRAIS